jgi:deazaflavin-dependent oxidoreductase (nitroreductase family)
MTDYNTQIIDEFRAHHGKVAGMFAGMDLLVLTTTGAKSGEPRLKPLAYSQDGDRYVVVASFGGAPVNPAWYHNLVAHPEATVEVGDQKFLVHATLAHDAESDRLFEQHASKYPQFNEYKRKTTRHLPVFVLEPVKA